MKEETLREKRIRAGRMGGKAPHKIPTTDHFTAEQRKEFGRRGGKARAEKRASRLPSSHDPRDMQV